MAVGIIAEYNPFHNGHKYHLNKVKQMHPNDTIILVMSSYFTQHGEVSLLNKWDKTKIALEEGIDLVIELPFLFATQSADTFAKGAIEILNALQVDTLVFGSETNNVIQLEELVYISLYNETYHKLIKEYLKEGINYPTALSKALYKIKKIEINKPNDLLSFSYLKEIKKQNAKIKIESIQRTNDYHDKNLGNKISSATSIRQALKEKKNISSFVPKTSFRYLQSHLTFTEEYFSILKYKILTSHNLENIQTVDEGIQNKIKKEILTSSSFDECIKKTKTKRYTYSKLKRMCIHMLCDLTKEEVKLHPHIEYIRILGFSKKGQQYLNKQKKNIKIPIISRISKKEQKLLEIEIRATCAYASILEEKEKQKIIEMEWKQPPIQIEKTDP